MAAQRAGAQLDKTSTGFVTGGAIITDVLTMRQAVGPNMGVKASGGIKTKADVDAFVKAGATRIGTSNGVQIMTDSAPQESY